MKQYKIPKIKLTYVADVGVIEKPALRNSVKVAEVFRNSYEEGEIDFTEQFKVLYLSRTLKPLGLVNHSGGHTTNCLVDIKLILVGALLTKAECIMVSHNHPSGNLAPSAQDDQVTQQIKTGCEAVGLRLLDHVIVTRGGHYSYCDNQRL